MVFVYSWRDPSVLSLINCDKKDTLDLAKVSFLFGTVQRMRSSLS